ncbi:MAG: patatin-like phospholipase family protein [Gemmatimonadaceae bacterium]
MSIATGDDFFTGLFLTHPDADIRAAISPVVETEAEQRLPPASGAGLCLSGGGYRAMLFHAGVIWRLNELGLLPKLTRISSVSGGSITAGLLACRWNDLAFTDDIASRFTTEIVEPIRTLAGVTIDTWSVIRGVLLPGSVSDRIANAYDKHLYHGAKLDEIPRAPRFIINATNVQTGVLCRFSRGEMRDYRVGRFLMPDLPLSRAVAASSSFPPVLSPTVIKPGRPPEEPADGEDLRRAPFTTKLVLSDGGVYDNLGLETVWKNCATVLVSDAGGELQPEGKPASDWARHSYRILNVIDNQVRSLRKRQVVGSLELRERKGAFWSIRVHRDKYSAESPLSCPPERTAELAAVPTRLARLDGAMQERLINWGYAICDIAMRTYVDPALPVAPEFPYPGRGV